MARAGGNPNIAEAGKNTRFGSKHGYSAVKAAEKSNEQQARLKKLNEDLKERCTPERMAKLNDKLLNMAEKGNLKAYELVRDGLGEKPIERHAIGVTDKSLERMAEDFSEDM